ncbi:MAG: general secretion pathway protein GspK [Verrucomicrobia bacterium]|nr:general secretion pathway protein GspK [Verrucomicrobiota bacterium]
MIVVLAIVAILSVVVLEFASSIRVEMYVSANYDAHTQALYAAKAGLEYAIYVLRTDEDMNKDWLGDAWAKPLELTIGAPDRAPEPESVDGSDEYTLYTPPARERDARVVEARIGGTARVSITDEERKIGLYSVHGSQVSGIVRETLERLLDELHVPGAAYNASDIVEQIVDWTDQDDEGVWEYTYEGLEDPYVPTNRAFRSVAELRLLADMSDALLYGTVPFPEDQEERDVYENGLQSDWSYGLINFVHAQSIGLININTAPREVLTALFDDSYAAEEIIDWRREQGGFSNTDDVLAIVQEATGNDPTVTRALPLTVRSLFFRITSVGEYHNVRVKITAIVYCSTRGDVSVQYYRVETVQ